MNICRARRQSLIFLSNALRITVLILLHPNSVFWQKTNYQIEGIEEQRMVNSYAQWMLQHPLGFADSLAPIERRNIRLFANAKSLARILWSCAESYTVLVSLKVNYRAMPVQTLAPKTSEQLLLLARTNA